MSTLLTTSQTSHGDAVVVSAEGEVDLVTAGQLADALAAGNVARVLVADLRGVRFLGSAGLAVLVSAATEGVGLVVVAPQGGIARRALHLTGLEKVLTIVDDVADAVRPRQPDATP